MDGREAGDHKPYVDFLATTMRFGVANTDGLLREVPEGAGYRRRLDGLRGRYSENRYMGPARRENIFAFYYVPQQACDLEAPQPRINSLRKLESILSSHVW